MSDQAQGMLLLFGCTCSPWLVGAVIGWRFRGRVDRYGFPGALLPGFVRDRWL